MIVLERRDVSWAIAVSQEREWRSVPGDSSGDRVDGLGHLRAAVLCSGEEGKEHPFCSVNNDTS